MTRLTASGLVQAGSALLVFAIVFKAFGQGQPTVLFDLLLLFMLAAAIAFFLLGGAAFLRSGTRVFDRRSAALLLAGAAAGVALTALMAAYRVPQPGAVGYPLMFYEKSCHWSCIVRKDNVAFAADSVFWALLIYPTMRLARSAVSHRLEQAGRLDILNFSVFTIFGSALPFGWAGWAFPIYVTLLPLLGSHLGYALMVVAGFLPVILVALFAAATGHRRFLRNFLFTTLVAMGVVALLELIAMITSTAIPYL